MRPARLALPHFGEVAEPEPHLDAVRAQLRGTRELIDGGAGEDEYAAATRAELAGLDADLARRYELVVPIDQNYAGLKRWADNR